MKAIKVSELNKYIKKYIAMDYLLSDISVKGEISNLNKHSKGNIYLSLKDDKAKINAIIYSREASKINFELQNGDNVEAGGSISLYERDGSINMYIREIKKVGMGDLYEKYLALKDALYKEGLFSEEHKKPISYFPRKVGVITSPTGAAIADFINILQRRNKAVDILFYPSNVQGDFAASNLIEGLEYFEENPVDVVVIGRGGGSLEELFAFNDEKLARKIYELKIPVISAVGHEIDYVISDFVSDLRAPTPSAAAELVSMSNEDLNNSLFLIKNRMDHLLHNKINKNRRELSDKFNFLKYDLLSFINSNRVKLNYYKNLIDLKKTNFKKIRVTLEDSKTNLDYNIICKIKDFNEKLQSANQIKLKLIEKVKKEKTALKFCENALRAKNLRGTINLQKKDLYINKEKLGISMSNYLKEKNSELMQLKDSLDRLNPSKLISIRDENLNLVISAKKLKINGNIHIDFEDGTAEATVKDVKIRGEANGRKL
ncbi:exodeoxyribonuclease VII, large subunit [Peptoniphilus sp. ING2-D1G]|nr:exodeoxyribonuclease VII, large subunit [Peptoniphilus sp. ING2-D1G]